MSWDTAFGQSLTGSKTATDSAEAFGSHYDYAAAEYMESAAPRSTSKWEELQPMHVRAEGGTSFPVVQDPTQMEIPTCSALRIRREQNGRDFVNSRLWDNFHATPPTQVSSETLQASKDPKFMDMNPVGTRKGTGAVPASTRLYAGYECTSGQKLHEPLPYNASTPRVPMRATLCANFGAL